MREIGKMRGTEDQRVRDPNSSPTHFLHSPPPPSLRQTLFLSTPPPPLHQLQPQPHPFRPLPASSTAPPAQPHPQPFRPLPASSTAPPAPASPLSSTPCLHRSANPFFSPRPQPLHCSVSPFSSPRPEPFHRSLPPPSLCQSLFLSPSSTPPPLFAASTALRRFHRYASPSSSPHPQPLHLSASPSSSPRSQPLPTSSPLPPLCQSLFLFPYSAPTRVILCILLHHLGPAASALTLDPQSLHRPFAAVTSTSGQQPSSPPPPLFLFCQQQRPCLQILPSSVVVSLLICSPPSMLSLRLPATSLMDFTTIKSFLDSLTKSPRSETQLGE